jgi:hypothetical protein
VPPILLGTSISGKGDAARRERDAQASLHSLSNCGAAVCVNLGFAGEASTTAILPTLPILTHDARTVTGVQGARKPVVSEMIDALAAEAGRRGLTRIGIVNGDIVVTASALARDAECNAPCAAFSRTDLGGGEPEVNLLYGVDMFTFDVAFWRRERRRFRPYLLGEPVWDNVYGAIVACHGGTLFNRERLILHQRHLSASESSVYRSYVQRLAARDSSYFTLWCAYVERAAALRARGGRAQEEYALQRTTFVAPGPAASALDVLRGSWWRMKRAIGA